MTQEKYIDRIHQYLHGMLPGNEKDAFESEMMANPQLKLDVEIERKLLKGIELVGDQQLKATIQNTDSQLEASGFFERHSVEAERASTASGRIWNLNRVLALAASVLIILAALWWFTQRSTSLSNQELFTQYYTPEKTHVTQIISDLENFGLAGEPTAEDSLREALLLYQEYQFKDCITALTTYLNTHPAHDTATFYLALAYLNESQYAEAAEYLQPLIQKDAFALQGDAIWYLALCYLQMEDGEQEAVQLFEILAANDDYQMNKTAKNVLQQLYNRR